MWPDDCYCSGKPNFQQVGFNMNNTESGNVPLIAEYARCKVCVIRLDQICYKRAWWFRSFREVLVTGVRMFALIYRVPRDAYVSRSPMCHGCMRFCKNVVKRHSPLFNYFDAYLNPFFNRVRDSLLTAEELAWARGLAERAADRDFVER
ncbi:MAG: hypothetical protein IPK66_07455 [Rhodospirillales bacterium]|nr:hypothetical protein [Rhodospirillales bacterium]